MKTVVNVLLGLFIVGLVWICVASIMGPINFKEEKDARDEVVKERLLQIRDAQREYRRQKATYTDNFDTLINFVKTGKMSVVAKQGELTDQQLEDGMTERKAMTIINKAKKSYGDKWQSAKEVVAAGLQGFVRDTVWVNIIDTLFAKGFTPDSMRYVPLVGAKFDMAIKNDTLDNGTPRNFFEASTPYTVYLNGLDKQEIANAIDIDQKLGKFPGMMVGSLENPIDAGNWE
ncbi:MAG: hypothetical protein LBM61_03490 [Prevotellaceae bacterium]|nr:hypothetical protein [Prevotellaceae bacterium]